MHDNASIEVNNNVELWYVIRYTCTHIFIAHSQAWNTMAMDVDNSISFNHLASSEEYNVQSSSFQYNYFDHLYDII